MRLFRTIHRQFWPILSPPPSQLPTLFMDGPIYIFKFQNLFTYENKKIKTSKLKTLKVQDLKRAAASTMGTTVHSSLKTHYPYRGDLSLHCSALLCAFSSSSRSQQLHKNQRRRFLRQPLWLCHNRAKYFYKFALK